jgi:hypothetical protein
LERSAKGGGWSGERGEGKYETVKIVMAEKGNFSDF